MSPLFSSILYTSQQLTEIQERGLFSPYDCVAFVRWSEHIM